MDTLPPKVLLVARDMVGDLVNTTGAVLALQAAFPKTSFTLEGGLAAPELFPKSIRVWARPRHAGLSGRIKRILRWRKAKFGACLILDDGHTHARLARLAGIPRIVGVHRGRSELFTQSIPFDENGHDLFDSLRGVLRLVGIEPPDLHPRLAPTPTDEQAAERLFNELGQPEILLHVGASDPRKNWPDESWSELIGALGGRKLAAIAGPGEDAARFGIPTPGPATALLVYAALLTRVKLLITPDTGPAHLAAAMNAPTVVLYGPTDPKRFHPWDNGNQRLLRMNSDCEHYGHGCGHLQNGRCSHRCMLAITPASVAALVNQTFIP